MKKILVLIVLIMVSLCLNAEPVITSVTRTNVICGNDGSITVNATGTAPIYYALINPSTIEKPAQLSNVFSNLPAGSYTVAAYDAVNPNTPTVQVVTITGSYTSVGVVSAVASTYLPSGSSQYCVETGRVSVTISGGITPYTYKLTGPSPSTLSSSSKSQVFDALKAGTYQVSITDNCGSVINTGTLNVTSAGAKLLSTTFNTAAATMTFNASCTSVTASFSSILVNGVQLSAYPGIRYRIFHNGVYSSWATVSANATYPYSSLSVGPFNSAAPQVYVEIEHPCTQAVRRSGAYNVAVSNPQRVFMHSSLMYNPCTGVLDSVRNIINYDGGTPNPYLCYPYTVTMIIGGKTITFDNTSPWLPANTPYTIVSVIDGSGANVTSSIQNIGRTIANTIAPTSIYSLESTTESSPTGCTFASVTAKLRLNLLTAVKEGGWYYTGGTQGYIYPTSVKFTLTSGPNFASYTPIEFSNTNMYGSSTANYTLWTNLQSGGAYTVRLDVVGKNGCTYTRNIPLTATPKYTGFNGIVPTLSSNCGVNIISGRAWYINNGGSVNTTETYRMEVYNSSGSLVGTSAYVASNTPMTLSGNYLTSGTYTVKYRYGDCYFGAYTLVIPTYNPLQIDGILSGGITCESNGMGTLTVIASNGVGTKFYRIKVKGAPDASYTAYTRANVFANKYKGEYTVQIKDNCGEITGNVTVHDGKQQFITVEGTIEPGVVCEGKKVTLGAYSIGPVVSYKWSKKIGSNFVPIPGATLIDYVIPVANAVSVGTYKVEINTGTCILSSEYDVTRVSEPSDKPTITGPNSTSCGTVYLKAHISATSAVYMWYRNGVFYSQTTSNTIAVSTVGNYSVVAIPTGLCASDTSEIHVVGTGALTGNTIAAKGDICLGTTLTTSEIVNALYYQWYKDGVFYQQTSTNTITVYLPGTYTVRYRYGSCVSSFGPALVIAPKLCISTKNDAAVTVIHKPVNVDVLANDNFGECTRATLTAFDTIVNSGLHLGSLVKNPDLTLTYLPTNKYGIDSVDYYITCNTDSSSARLYVAILKPLSNQYIACEGSTPITIGVATIPNVKYYWYTAATGGTEIASDANTISVTKDASDFQTWYVEARYNGVVFPRYPVYLELSSNCGGTAPIGCAVNGSLLFKEDFGGNSVDDPDVKPTGIPQVVGYTYNGTAYGHGTYGIRKQSFLHPNNIWYVLDDHTFQNDVTKGYMLQVDATAASGQFYEHQLNNLCSGTTLYFSAWITSVAKVPTFVDRTNMIFVLEDLEGNIISKYYTGNIPDVDPDWKQYGFSFKVPSEISSLVLKIINNGTGTSGNDFVMDDIEIRLCAPLVDIINPISSDTTVCPKTAFVFKGEYTDTPTAFGNNLVARWEFSTTGDISTPSDWVAVGAGVTSSTGNIVATYSIASVTDASEGYYRMLVGNAGTINTQNCRASSRVIYLRVDNSPEYSPDVRVQICTNSGQINLSKYLDTIKLKSVTWNVISGPIIGGTSGLVNSSDFFPSRTYVYKYKVTNACYKPEGKIFVTALKNTSLGLPPDTVVVCKKEKSAQHINLNRIVGIEASGSWKYDNTVNIDNVVANNVSIATAPAVYHGAHIFHAAQTWSEAGAVYIIPGGYNGDINAKAFKFRYITTSISGSCLADSTKEVIVIVTEKIVP